MRHRRAQSAVEVMLVAPVAVLVLLAMLQLFTLTFAAENAHLRAREHVLHGTAYLRDRAWRTGGTTVFDEAAGTYRVAAPGPFRFESRSSDHALPGLGTEALKITAVTVIASE